MWSSDCWIIKNKYQQNNFLCICYHLLVLHILHFQYCLWILYAVYLHYHVVNPVLVSEINGGRLLTRFVLFVFFLYSFCPTDTKFVSSSDDGTVRVWDFLRCYEEKILRGMLSLSVFWRHVEKTYLQGFTPPKWEQKHELCQDC